MKESVQGYAERIERGEISPLTHYNGKQSGLILDPRSQNTPLNNLGFGVWQLKDGPFTVNTLHEEYVIVPQESEFEIQVKEAQKVVKTISGKRASPFTQDESSNACAIYVPRSTSFEIEGSGEVIFYTAPAHGDKPFLYIAPNERSYISRGLLSWRRDVITLITPNESTNLVVGETYSPPGLWSGTPLHRHDGVAQGEGESDHEEVYYHIMRYRGGTGLPDEVGPYGVQLLFDGQTINQAYIVRNRSIMAIPGLCHPVVASPVTDHIYGWGLGGRGEDLGMRDMPEFAYLKNIEKAFKDIAKKLSFQKASVDERGMFVLELSLKTFKEISEKYTLDTYKRGQLKLMLREYGIQLVASA